MEADRLERGLAGREVRFLPDSYLFTRSIVPLFVLKVHSPLALITVVDSGLWKWYPFLYFKQWFTQVEWYKQEANNRKNQSGCRCSGRNGSWSNRNWSTSRKTWKFFGKRWLTLICLSTTMVVIIAMACTVACSMVPSLCCWPTTDR